MKNLTDRQTRAAMGSMDLPTFYERVSKKTVSFPERITVLEAYALSKGAHEKKLKSMSEVSHLIRHGTYHVEQIIERFTRRDWEAVARGETRYSPPANG